MHCALCSGCVDGVQLAPCSAVLSALDGALLGVLALPHARRHSPATSPPPNGATSTSASTASTIASSVQDSSVDDVSQGEHEYIEQMLAFYSQLARVVTLFLRTQEFCILFEVLPFGCRRIDEFHIFHLIVLHIRLTREIHW